MEILSSWLTGKTRCAPPGPPGPGGPPWGPPPGPGWGRSFPVGECCAGPGCCLLGLTSPLLAVVIPVRAIGAVARRGGHRDSGGHRGMGRPHGAVARLMYRGVRFYQAEISALTPACPHSPSCSQYAAEALDRHGAARGTWLTARRLLRCRPGTAGGFDPVPSPTARGGRA
jgi:uncharacterized protein